MLPAIIEIHQALIRSGYSEEEADALVARLMEEEAFDFVECIKNYENHNTLSFFDEKYLNWELHFFRITK